MGIITLNGIGKVYCTKEIETTALENVNLDVNEGEFLSIMGPSGCGKSTLLNIIGLLDKPTRGTVSILGQDCSGLSDRELSHFRNANLEGVAEPPLVKAPRIGYFGRIGDFSRFVRIFDSQDVENRLYNKKTAKIGLFRPIFVCFYAISGY